MSISDNIAYYRKKCQLTQKQLASMMNKSEKVIQEYENGVTEPTIKTLYPLAEVLGITLEQLIADKITTDKTPSICNEDLKKIEKVLIDNKITFEGLNKIIEQSKKINKLDYFYDDFGNYVLLRYVSTFPYKNDSDAFHDIHIKSDNLSGGKYKVLCFKTSEQLNKKFRELNELIFITQRLKELKLLELWE